VPNSYFAALNIAINTRLLLKNKLEGIGWFTYETLKRITVQHPEHCFFFLFDRPYSEEFIFSDNITPVVVGPQARHPVLWYLWFEWSIPAVLKRHKADLFISPDGYLSLKTNVPSLPVIHDLNFEHYPEYMPFFVRKYYHFYFPKFARKAVRIATVSEFSKRDIIEKYGIDAGTIDVVYNGANEIYRPISEEEKQKTRNKYSGGVPFFLFTGALLPRKNVANIFTGFDQFRRSYPNGIKLLIVGKRKWWTKEIRNAYENMQYKNEVIFRTHLPPEELKNIIPSALAMIYVSFFEGFGIPIIEAMRCGTPVITSNVTSMPEVAGDAALFVNPFSIDSIAAAMLKIAEDENLRKELNTKGLERSKDFSWQKTADRLWDCVEKTLIGV